MDSPRRLCAGRHSPLAWAAKRVTISSKRFGGPGCLATAKRRRVARPGGRQGHPSRLSDEALLARIADLAGRERFASVELIAHLAELAARPAVHLGKGRSLYLYCTEVLHLSEHAAYNRIGAARAARKFPVILDLLADGSVNVTTVTLLAPHLAPENHRALLGEATHRTKEEVKAIVRRLSPLPDAPTVIRKLPVGAAAPAPALVPVPALPPPAAGSPPPLVLQPHAPRPVIESLAPDRYRVQVTVGKETHDKLRR